MGVKAFGDYSECYNALYQDKDYAGEAAFVLKKLRQHRAKKGNLLELGCGTGSYTRLLVRNFESVVGIDLSPTMLKQAAAQLSILGPKLAAKISYDCANLQSLRLRRKFDVAVALFHVMSYQVGNDDLARAFASAARHLKPGGLFFFDFWSGPGVLHCLPEPRVKKVETERIQVVRHAAPRLHLDRNTVEVTYDIELRRKPSRRHRTFREKHFMRYLFKPELEAFCLRSGFRLLELGEWLTGRPPGLDSWSGYVVARKVQ